MSVPPPLPIAEPSPTPDDAPFWTALSERRLVLPRCRQCGTYIWYPRTFCSACHTAGVDWVEASGRGSIYSYTVSRRGLGPWSDRAPYVIAYVELEEGPRVMTNIVGCDPDDVAIGQLVTAAIEIDQGAPALRFAPDRRGELLVGNEPAGRRQLVP